MRWLVPLLLVVPMVGAQLPHPHEDLVHHPLTIQAELEAIRDQNPEYITMGSFGQSVAAFPLWYLDFVHPDLRGDPIDHYRTPVFYLDANHHGNEQLGMEALLIFMRELAAWSLTPEGQERLKEVRIVAAPMINPDGTGTDKRVNTRGVDLNRNYDYNWGLYGTSDMMNPVTGNYRGDAPHSEPESEANAAFMYQLMPAVYLSMHTGSHDIVLPWRQDPNADGPMPDWPVYERWLGNIQNVSGLGYRDPSGAGESISYAYGRLGALSLIVEVDQLQTEVVVAEMADRLKEEVAIFWDTLENFEYLGGYLVQEGRVLRNVGWGPATNVTLRDVRVYGHPEYPVADQLAPGETVAIPDIRVNMVSYDRTLQGKLAREEAGEDVASWWGTGQLRLVHTEASAPEEHVSEPAPAPGLALLVALAALAALRRRTP